MARRKNGLRKRKNEPKVDARFRKENLNYHEGLSANQVKIILRESGFGDYFNQFDQWMYGQTCPIVQRHNLNTGRLGQTVGVYEYDLFRWIKSQKTGIAPIWD